MSRSKLKPYINEIREKRLSGVQIQDLADEYGVSKPVMSQFLYRKGIILTNDDNIINAQNHADEIIKEYNDGKGYTIIAKEYRVGARTIKKILISNGAKIRDNSSSHRIYDLNEDYFDNINTPNKAYILGLLYADGNINRSAGHYTMAISLQGNDVDILEKIKKELQFSGPLHFKNLSKKNSNWKNQWSLNINNKHMVESLIDYGVIPNKSLTLSFPDFLTEDLLPHFLRGFWDGDGHISTKCWLACCVGNEKFIFKMKEIIEELLNIHCLARLTLSPSGKIYDLRITGIDNTTKFLNYIYKDADLYMERKYNYYIEKYCNNSQ